MDEIGYYSYYEVLNSKDYGIPQNRERVFTVSIRKDIDIFYKFPPEKELKLKLKDMLEKEVDEKYYISDKMKKAILGNAVDKNLKDVYDRNKCKFNPNIAYTLNQKPDRRVGDSNYIVDNCDELLVEDYLKIKNATKKGYLKAYEGDGIDISSRMQYHRGTVQKDMIQTLDTQATKGVIDKGLKIRKLTPKECWRLMGFDDEDFEKASKVNSDTQLYKQAGNSIVVNVLEAILTNLLIEKNQGFRQTTIFDYL